MTGVGVVNIAVTIGLLPALVVIARRPTARWRHGRPGKAVSLAAVLVITVHLGFVLVPLGAITALARHRRDSADPSSVPTADSWPGA